MKKDLSKIIEIPEGVEVSIEKGMINIKGKAGEVRRNFSLKGIIVEKTDNKVKLSFKKATKKEKKIMNTIAAHIKNMIQGVQEKYEYNLRICNSHFPMNVEIKGKEAIIKNFLGERVARKTKILDNVDVDIDKDRITIKSADCEAAGQTAANLEKATWIRLRDRRIFQDGIFITSKPGREF